jgi:hypothetical protein
MGSNMGEEEGQEARNSHSYQQPLTQDQKADFLQDPAYLVLTAVVLLVIFKLRGDFPLPCTAHLSTRVLETEL